MFFTGAIAVAAVVFFGVIPAVRCGPIQTGSFLRQRIGPGPI